MAIPDVPNLNARARVPNQQVQATLNSAPDLRRRKRKMSPKVIRQVRETFGEGTTGYLMAFEVINEWDARWKGLLDDEAIIAALRICSISVDVAAAARYSFAHEN